MADFARRLLGIRAIVGAAPADRCGGKEVVCEDEETPVEEGFTGISRRLIYGRVGVVGRVVV